jgi:4-amino-4-deoxy-L-arabinose transferase-like glycosyltransferase
LKVLKRLQYISLYERWMFASVAIATLLRFILIYFHWPFTDSDEGNMGLVALHVAYQGDHPIFFYGSNYLGPLEGYAAAPLFHLFGTSLFALRLPLVLFFTGFLLSMYYLFRLLYSEKFALATVILLSLGTSDVFFLQLRASGEYPEIEMFAALICLLAAWLALSSHRAGQEPGRQKRWKRIVIYGLLGLIVGLASWVDLLILPFVAAAGLLLLLFCRRELLSWTGLSLLLGFVVGAFPLIYYNLTAPPSQNSWFVLLSNQHAGASDMVARHLTWVNQLTGTMIVALPTATGGGVQCPLSAIPPSGSPTPTTLPCVLFQGGWSFGYLMLWFIALGLAVYAVRRYRRQVRSGVTESASEERQEVIRQCGRLMLLASAGLTLLLYATSPTSATGPDTTFRYLTCMLLAVPAILWPVWQGLSTQKISLNWRSKGALLLRGALLLLVTTTLVTGTVRTFLQIPTAQVMYQRQETLVQDLLHVGATRVYADYWTCNILTFLSREKIICSALDEQLNPGYDRYMPYRFIVRAAPHPAYVFLPGTKQIEAVEQRVNLASSHYRHYIFEGYVVYLVT